MTMEHQIPDKSWKTWLTAIVNLLTVLSCILTIISVASRYYRPTQPFAGRPDQISAKSIGIGDSVLSILADHLKQERTLVLGLSTHCVHCSSEIPVYQRIKEQRPDLPMIALFRENRRDVESYLRSLQFEIDSLDSVPFHRLKIFSTPYIILVDRNGKVIKFWRGHLSENSEKEIVTQISH